MSDGLGDSSNPWGGPTERKVDFSTVELLLRLVDTGRGLAALMSPDEPKRKVRLEKLWQHHQRAESMLLTELGRRRRVAKQLEQQAKELEGPSIVEEEDEDEEDDEDDFDPLMAF